MTAMFNHNNNNTRSASANCAEACFACTCNSKNCCGTAVLLIMGAVFAASIIIMPRVCGIAAICVLLAVVLAGHCESPKTLTLFP